MCKSRAVLLTLVAVCGCAGPQPGPASPIRDERLKMGTRFEIQVAGADEVEGRAAIEAAYAEIDRIEALLSEWRDDSEISELNRRAGESPMQIGPDLLTVIEESIRLSRITEGAFDITFAACGGLWGFDPPRIPDAQELERCLARVDYRLLELDAELSTAWLPRPGMRIGIAGIGKGYGVDRAAETLERRGIHNYVVDGGGDIRISGTNGERAWQVGVAHPRRAGELWGTLERGRGAIVTSGDYFKYFEREGVRYHHIVDPRDGMPARGAMAVTVIAERATTADALATGLLVLGPERGLALVERLPGTEAFMIDAEMQTHRTPGFPEIQGP